MTGSLRLRLLVGAGFFIALGLVVAWFSLQQVFAAYVSAQYEREMQTVVDALAAAVEFEDGALVVEDRPDDPRFSLPAGGRYWEVEPRTGEPLRSRSLWDTRLDMAALAASPYPAFSMGAGPDGSPLLVLTRNLSFETEGAAGVVMIHAGFDAAELQASLGDFRRELAVMLALIAVLLMVAALLQVHVGLRPLLLLREDLARIRTGEMVRVVSEVPTEVRPLVAEINDLLAERAAAVDRARARASDLAHGLKTPLTAIVQIAEKLPQEAGQSIIEHVAMIRRRADRQLQRARIGAGHAEGSDVAAIAEKLVPVMSTIP